MTEIRTTAEYNDGMPLCKGWPKEIQSQTFSNYQACYYVIELMSVCTLIVQLKVIHHSQLLDRPTCQQIELVLLKWIQTRLTFPDVSNVSYTHYL